MPTPRRPPAAYVNAAIEDELATLLEAKNGHRNIALNKVPPRSLIV